MTSLYFVLMVYQIYTHGAIKDLAYGYIEQIPFFAKDVRIEFDKVFNKHTIPFILVNLFTMSLLGYKWAKELYYFELKENAEADL